MSISTVDTEHLWDLTPRAAIELQETLKYQVLESPLDGPVASIAGTDVSIKGTAGRASVVVLSRSDQRILDCASVEAEVQWPYVPGLLAFREIPLIMRAFRKLRVMPDAVMTDGHGRAHPRRFGLACHLGLVLNLPTLGVAKRRYVGQYTMPSADKGSYELLTQPASGEVLGAVVRTRDRVSPVFVSVGHRISLADSVALTLDCAVRFRIPEPTRLAHLASRRWHSIGPGT